MTEQNKTTEEIEADVDKAVKIESEVLGLPEDEVREDFDAAAGIGAALTGTDEEEAREKLAQGLIARDGDDEGGETA